jgi:hypothetical protein
LERLNHHVVGAGIVEFLGEVGIHFEIHPALLDQADHLLRGRSSEKQEQNIIFGQRLVGRAGATRNHAHHSHNSDNGEDTFHHAALELPLVH